MLKRIIAVSAAAAGLMMISAPAFAGDLGYPPESDESGQVGLVNVTDVNALNDISGALGLCGNDVSAVGVTVPVLSPDTVGNCAASGVADSGDHD